MGLFVVLEGVDHTGKSTLIKNLQKQLQDKGLHCVTTFEPGKTLAGQKLRDLLVNAKTRIHPETEFLLFLTDRYQHYNSFIIPQLKSTNVDVVICDRYFYSTFVYQGEHKGVNTSLIYEFHERLGLFKHTPDLVFFIHSNSQTLINRLQQKKKKTNGVDRFHNDQGVQYFDRIQTFYSKVFKKHTNLYNKLVKIDTEKPLQDNVQKMKDIIIENVQKNK